MPSVGSQILELNLLSARDLPHVSKSMKAFAVVWINPDRKLETQPDNKGQNNPSWNEKFTFRVDSDSLAAGNDSVNVEIYAMTRRNEVVIAGSVSVLIASLFPPAVNPTNRKKTRQQSKTRYLSLQIRRPSGRPQGVLEIGVALLDWTRRSMPLSCSELSASVAAFGDSDLVVMDEKRLLNHRQHHHRSSSHKKKASNPSPSPNPNTSPSPNTTTNTNNRFRIRRSKSERSVSEVYILKSAATESDSVISDSVANYGNNKEKGSICSDVGPSPSVVAAAIAMGMYPTPPLAPPPAVRKIVGGDGKNNKFSAVEETAESSILDDWVEEDNDSVEGLKTKIERWRSEIHPLYQKTNENYQNNNSNNQISQSTYKKNSSGDLAAMVAAATPSLKRDLRRPGSGLFSCFGTAYGCEFSITCGGGRRKKGEGEEDEAPMSFTELHYGDQYV